MKISKVSVIIPTYNRSTRLIKAIESVQNQTYKNLEILVCDDCSTDNTRLTISNLIKSDPRIRYFSTNINSGLPAVPRNLGLSNATGEWIAFLDDDDIWLSNKLEKQLSLLEESKLLACSTNAFGDSSKKVLLNFYKNHITFCDQIKGNKVILSSLIISSKIANKIKFPSANIYKAFEDYGFSYLIINFTDIAFLNDPLVIYTENNTDSIRNNSLKDYRKIKCLALKPYLERFGISGKYSILCLFAFIRGKFR